MQRTQPTSTSTGHTEPVKQGIDNRPPVVTTYEQPTAATAQAPSESPNGLGQPGDSLVEFMRRSPLYGRDDITCEAVRDPDRERDVELGDAS